MSNLPSSSASSSSSSYAGPQGAGGSSHSSATSPARETSTSQQSNFVPGATSASANASAQASDQGAGTTANVSVPAGEQRHSSDPTSAANSSESEEEPATNGVNEIPQTPLVVAISLLLGTPDNNLLLSTAQRDIFWGGAGADIFQLLSTGVADLNQADIILDYSSAAGDRLALSATLTAEALIFDVVDFSGDGTADSTVVRSAIDNTILGVVLNSVNELGETLLSTADFLDPAAVQAWVASNPSPELETEAEPETSGSGQTSSSSSSFADGSGAGSSSSATATDSEGNTSSSSDLVYNPEAIASSGSASAIANENGANTATAAQASTASFDVLIGTANNDMLVSTSQRTFFLGGDGADIFVLSDIGYETLDAADVILDFSAEAGDLIQLRGGLNIDDIALEAVDIDNNGVLDGVLISHATNGSIYALVLGTVDSLGTSTLVGEHFSAPALP